MIRFGAFTVLWLASICATAAEPDACEEIEDVDAQMSCYAQRFCGQAAARRPSSDCYAKVIRSLLSGVPPPEPAPEPKPRTQPKAETHGRVAGIAQRAYGLRLFTLDNAEVWEEIASSRARIATGDAVRIVRGSLNSYRMFPERGGLLRVRRLACGRTADSEVRAKCRAASASVPDASTGPAG